MTFVFLSVCLFTDFNTQAQLKEAVDPDYFTKKKPGPSEDKDKRTDNSKYEYYPSVQSLEDLEEQVILDEGDEDVKIVYRMPETCREFSLYLETKRKKLNKMDKEIQQNIKVLKKLKKEFEAVVAKYTKAEKRVKNIMNFDPTNLEDNKDLQKIVKIYESFSPEDAAARLKNLDLDMTLAILKKMNPKKMSKILTALDPRISAALSSQIVRGF